MQTAIRLFVCALLSVASVHAFADVGDVSYIEGSPPFSDTATGSGQSDGLGGASAEPQDTARDDDATASDAHDDFLKTTWMASP